MLFLVVGVPIRSRLHPAQEAAKRHCNVRTDARRRDHPEQLFTFFASFNAGMRFGSEYSVVWSQLNFDRSEILLPTTKICARQKQPLVTKGLFYF